jgi:hypothetical protein
MRSCQIYNRPIVQRPLLCLNVGDDLERQVDPPSFHVWPVRLPPAMPVLARRTPGDPFFRGLKEVACKAGWRCWPRSKTSV